ncbi:hypothetical protein B0H11DRAFT_2412949 [Mycena galericulata]|nr:hypothetical protein B0H11DRAFT_2412949 [Mycena galericulata]
MPVPKVERRVTVDGNSYVKAYHSNDPELAVPFRCTQCKILGSKTLKVGFHYIFMVIAVQYCSKDCQNNDWKGVGLRKIAGENSHKRQCAWFKRSMEQWPQVTSIQKLFSWSATLKNTHEMPWIPNQIELLLGLSGERAENGYWREHLHEIGSSVHDDLATRVWSDAYICHGSMLLESRLPPHVESWKIPSTQIPHLSFEEPDSRRRIPALHDTNFVQDWATWYEWRKLELDSPVALRMDMVLTVYHLLTKVLGVVDTAQAAAKMRRKLTVHYIGAAKELNVIPLFSELALLIPNTDIVITFFGPACKQLRDIATQRYPRSLAAKSAVYEYSAPPLLGASKVEIDGRDNLYGTDTAFGGDRPDALISENAGLFAYMTRQIVYHRAARESIPWGITEYHMNEAIEYEEHMVQWRDLAIQGCRMEFDRTGASAEQRSKARDDAVRAARAQASGADLNPFMRPGLMESGSEAPRAYNGFVLRVC